MQILLQEIPEQIRPSRQREEWSKEKWSEAARVLKPYLECNPYNGDYWGYYGFANEKLGYDEEALAAYRKAITYGSHDEAEAAYRLGRMLALLGKGDEALKWLEVSLRAALHTLKEVETDSAWDGLRNDPRFQRQLPPQLPSNIDRVTGWQRDVNYLALRMEQAHYDLFGPTNILSLTPAIWQETIERLQQRIPTLTDHEIVTELLKIIVLAGDGHTKLRPFDVKEGYLAHHGLVSLQIPVMFYSFQDGLFVRAAAPHYQESIGARVLTIGNLPVEQAMDLVSQVVPRDNAMTVLSESPWILIRPAILNALGIAERADQLTMRLIQENGEPFFVTFQAEQADVHWRRRGGVEPQAWISMRNPHQVVPLWLKDPDNWYWFEYLEEKKVVYCQYNQVGNKLEEPLEVFCERLFAFIDAHPVEALVIDLRLNGGGDLTTHRPLLHHIIRSKKINRKGHVFALIGRRTFSAAQHFTGQLELHTAVTFVGEPTGSRPNVVGEGNAFRLPFSGIEVNVSNLYWQYTFAFDHRQWIPPYLSVNMTSNDYKSNRDPALEAILEYF